MEIGVSLQGERVRAILSRTGLTWEEVEAMAGGIAQDKEK